MRTGREKDFRLTPPNESSRWWNLKIEQEKYLAEVEGSLLPIVGP